MLDSTEWAWRDMEVWLNGTKIGKVTKLTSKTNRESEHLHGAGDEPFDINPGNKTYSGEFETYGTVIRKMNQAARAMGHNDLTDAVWTITAKFKATTTTPVALVTIPNIRFDEYEEGGANNEKSFRRIIPYKSLRPIWT